MKFNFVSSSALLLALLFSCPAIRANQNEESRKTAQEILDHVEKDEQRKREADERYAKKQNEDPAVQYQAMLIGFAVIGVGGFLIFHISNRPTDQN